MTGGIEDRIGLGMVAAGIPPAIQAAEITGGTGADISRRPEERFSVDGKTKVHRFGNIHIVHRDPARRGLLVSSAHLPFRNILALFLLPVVGVGQIGIALVVTDNLCIVGAGKADRVAGFPCGTAFDGGHLGIDVPGGKIRGGAVFARNRIDAVHLVLDIIFAIVGNRIGVADDTDAGRAPLHGRRFRFDRDLDAAALPALSADLFRGGGFPVGTDIDHVHVREGFQVGIAAERVGFGDGDDGTFPAAMAAIPALAAGGAGRGILIRIGHLAGCQQQGEDSQKRKGLFHGVTHNRYSSSVLQRMASGG